MVDLSGVQNLIAGQQPLSPEVIEAAVNTRFAFIREFATAIAVAEASMAAISFALMTLPVQRASEYGASRLLRSYLADVRTIVLYAALALVVMFTAVLGAYAPMGLPVVLCRPLVLGGLGLSLALIYLHYIHVVSVLDLQHFMRAMRDRALRHLNTFEARFLRGAQFGDGGTFAKVRSDLDDAEGLRYIDSEGASAGEWNVPSPLEGAGEPLIALLELTQRFVTLERSEYASRAIGAITEVLTESFARARVERDYSGPRTVYAAPVTPDLIVFLQRFERWHAIALGAKDDQLAAALSVSMADLVTAAALAERGVDGRLWRGDSILAAVVKSATGLVMQCESPELDVLVAENISDNFVQAIGVTWASGHVASGKTLVAAFSALGHQAVQAEQSRVAHSALDAVFASLRINLAEPTETFVAANRAVMTGVHFALRPMCTEEGARRVSSARVLSEYVGDAIFTGVGSPLVEVAIWAMSQTAEGKRTDADELHRLEKLLSIIARFYLRLGRRAGQVNSPLANALAVDLDTALGRARGVLASPYGITANRIVGKFGHQVITALKEQLTVGDEWVAGCGEVAMNALFRQGIWFARDGQAAHFLSCDDALKAAWVARSGMRASDGDMRQGGVLERIIGLEVAARCCAVAAPLRQSQMDWIADRMRTEGEWPGQHEGDATRVGALLEEFLDVDGMQADALEIPYSFPPQEWRMRSREVLLELRSLIRGGNAGPVQ